MSDTRNLDVERAIELLVTARRVLDEACAKLCSVRHDSARAAYREIAHLSRRAVIARDELDAGFYTPGKTAIVRYQATCRTCGYGGRLFENKADAVSDGDDHEIAVGTNRKHHNTTVQERT